MHYLTYVFDGVEKHLCDLNRFNPHSIGYCDVVLGRPIGPPGRGALKPRAHGHPLEVACGEDSPKVRGGAGWRRKVRVPVERRTSEAAGSTGFPLISRKR